MQDQRIHFKISLCATNREILFLKLQFLTIRWHGCIQHTCSFDEILAMGSEKALQSCVSKNRQTQKNCCCLASNWKQCDFDSVCNKRGHVRGQNRCFSACASKEQHQWSSHVLEVQLSFQKEQVCTCGPVQVRGCCRSCSPSNAHCLAASSQLASQTASC